MPAIAGTFKKARRFENYIRIASLVLDGMWNNFL